jgi:iron complex outermembrane receptor protein
MHPLLPDSRFRRSPVVANALWNVPGRVVRALPFFVACGARVLGAEGVDGGLSVTALKRLSLEELANLEITSVAKRAEPLSGTPAAVHVLTGEDVQRSGATTVAESLRLVPGMQVARIDAHNWAVGARGFAEVFANKQLVLIDGRSVYTPLYSGVYWQYQDLVLEDLQQIEVIRGPGATVWGANAVNGVINVLTKPAGETQGLLLSAGGGDFEPVAGVVRYGGQATETTAYRVYGKYGSRENFPLADGSDAHDRWSLGQGGFRVDWDPSTESTFTLQGDVYGSAADQVFTQATLTPPAYSERVEDRVEAIGANVLGRWTRRFGADSELQVQSYYDLTRQEASFYDFTIGIFDIEARHRVGLGERHEVVWGLEYRLVDDSMGGSFPLSLDPPDRTFDVASLFVQDEIRIVPERLALTLGTKAEYNDFTDAVIQPGARLAWTPDERQTAWASVARAVRTPSRAEHDLVAHSQTVPPAAPGFPPSVATFLGDEAFGSEDLLAWEVGYRIRPAPRVSLDLALFYNDYRNLRTTDPGGPDFGTLPAYVTIPVRAGNNLDAQAYGGELAASFQVLENWRLRAGYSYLRIDADPQSATPEVVAQAASVEGSSPENQVFLVSQWDLPHDVTVDAVVRWVDRLEALDVPGYVTGDLRLAWRPRPGWELAVVGQNLFDNQHPEFTGSGLNGSVASEVPRSFYARLTWRY